ncbi:unnamed protein product, partial [Choristocarpus tenellus]
IAQGWSFSIPPSHPRIRNDRVRRPGLRRCFSSPPTPPPPDINNGYGVRIWGRGGVGQLGVPFKAEGMLGFDPYSELTPITLPGYATSGARDISCGADHTALVTTEGKLLTWGANTNHKLGHGTSVEKPLKTPRVVKDLEGVSIATVTCG